MKLLAQRRTSLLIAAVAGGALALLITRRLGLPLSIETFGWMLVGSAGLTTVMMLLLAVQLGADSRYALLQRWFPEAVVVQTYPSESLDRELAAFGPRLLGELPSLLITASVVFEQQQLSVWVGGQRPRAVLRLGWSEVTHFGIGTSARSLDRLVIGAQRDGSPIEVQFGVEHIGAFRLGTGKVDQVGLADIVRRVSELRQAPSTRVVAGPKVATLTTGLVPGLTAWAANRVAQLARVPLSAIIGIIGVAAGILVALGLQQAGAVIGGFGLIMTVVGLTGVWLERRARQRERAAGYTTLNGDELDLEQRHPHTGAVLRPAGEQPLSGDEFDGLLGR